MIEDREYMKRELARIYSPHTKEVKSAMKKLREDINRCPELVAALKQTRWNRRPPGPSQRRIPLHRLKLFRKKLAAGNWRQLLATKRGCGCCNFAMPKGTRAGA